MSSEQYNPSRLARAGWLILLVTCAILILHGTAWFFQGPEIALANIAEPTGVPVQEFREGRLSAFVIITLITRNSSVYEVALGLLAWLVAWHGYRHGTRWAWKASWVLVVALSALAADFVLAGGISPASAGYIIVGGSRSLRSAAGRQVVTCSSDETISMFVSIIDAGTKNRA